MHKKGALHLDIKELTDPEMNELDIQQVFVDEFMKDKEEYGPAMNEKEIREFLFKLKEPKGPLRKHGNRFWKESKK